MRSFFAIDLGYPYTGTRGALAPAPSDWVDARVLAAGVAEVHAVPADAEFVLFSANSDIYAKFGTSSSVTASVPAVDVTDGSAPILNPAARSLRGITHIALVSPMGCTVTMEFYKG